METLTSTDALLYGAVAISRHKLEDVDHASVDRKLQRLVEAVRKRTRSTQIQAVLAHMHDVLFEQEGFKGNTEDYYNPLNSFLPAWPSDWGFDAGASACRDIFWWQWLNPTALTYWWMRLPEGEF
jgi:hypothetical protein